MRNKVQVRKNTSETVADAPRGSGESEQDCRFVPPPALAKAEPATDMDQTTTNPEFLQRLAIRTQCEEIARFRNELSAKLGRSVSLDEAARAWIPSFASEWRSEFEAGLEAARTPVSFVPSFPVQTQAEHKAQNCSREDTKCPSDGSA